MYKYPTYIPFLRSKPNTKLGNAYKVFERNVEIIWK